MQDIFIVGAARTAIGVFGGSLKDHTPTQLGAIAARDAIRRSGLDPARIDQSVFGNVIPTEATDLYLGRSVALAAGLPTSSVGLTLNRLCGSGVQAIVTAAQSIALGESELALAGGAEVMSRAPLSLPAMRFGSRFGDATVYDWLANTLQDPFGHGHMGCTAENIAQMYEISRESQDAYALESQRRAAVAVDEGRFNGQIVPVEIRSKKGATTFEKDEHLRPQTSLSDLAKLRPVFREGGTVTAGNASGMNDGAAAVVLASGAQVAKSSLRPLGRVVSWAVAGVPPEIMGIGPVHAVPLALKRAGISSGDVDIIESNEAFAAQAMAVADKLGLDVECTNPCGGAIALGHPLGATGTILVVKALAELERTAGRYAVVTMCIGGGQGIAVVLERV